MLGDWDHRNFVVEGDHGLERELLLVVVEVGGVQGLQFVQEEQAVKVAMAEMGLEMMNHNSYF